MTEPSELYSAARTDFCKAQWLESRSCGDEDPPQLCPCPCPGHPHMSRRWARLTEATWKELLVPLWSRSWHMQEMKRAKISMSLGRGRRETEAGRRAGSTPVGPEERDEAGDSAWSYSR